ncbi:MAG TPA: histidine phosphatase family protein [Candidatus Nanoarchaeia archaeon]|nr:histidine phosphatase family protein [Candidatus Nanoarchaeia archaeon]
MRLILVRHGETDYNVQKLNQGWADSKLTEKGIEQARAVGQRLKDEKVDVAYFSDLLRTRESAEEILKIIKLPTQVLQWLRERNLGEFEHKALGSMKVFVQTHGLDLLSLKPKGGESILEFRERVKQGFDTLSKKEKGRTVLLITHGGVIAQLLLHVLKIDDKEYDHYHPENCALTILDVDERGAKPHLINCVKHL